MFLDMSNGPEGTFDELLQARGDDAAARRLWGGPILS